MPTFTYSVQINATPEKVFAYITEFSNHGAWYEYPWRIESTSPGPTGAGSTFRSIADDPFGKQTPNDITVSEFRAPARFCFTCTDPRFPEPTLHEFNLNSQAGGTFLERKFTSKPPFPINILIPYVIEPLIGRPSMLRSMNKIKAAMEA
jgi:uncharacterized protein YndB with AHSA1/START domain